MLSVAADKASSTEAMATGFLPPSPSWQVKATTKRHQRDEVIARWLPADFAPLRPDRTFVRDIPSTCGLLTEEQIAITETTASQLVAKLAAGLWSSETVLRAFIARATIAHHLTNPLSEVFFDRGIARAQELDRILKATGKPVGPLHGLPLSLKDVMHIAGEESNQGYVAWIGRISSKDDRLVAKLHDAGAVYYCKTNVPQTLMSGECVNFIYGRTSTPFNVNLSAGGSSGGEGSLISLGGSPLGIGTDIAGSIRTPANFNGIYGLCPSPERLPAHSAENSDSGGVIRAVAGPLSRSVDGLELYVRTVLGLRPWEWDPTCAPIPWREEEFQIGLGKKHRLCFGFVPHDSTVLPDPPIIRGMEQLRDALRKEGHQVVDLEPFDGMELMLPAMKVFGAGGGADVLETIAASGEPLIKEIIPPDPSTALSARDLCRAAGEVRKIREKYQDLWLATSEKTQTGLPVDAIIFPSGGHVAPPHGTMEYFTYEAVSNVLEWTCATVPVTKVDSLVDQKPDLEFKAMSDYDQRNWDKYTPEFYKDGPVCLQVLGQRFTEEKVLGLMMTINRALGRDEYFMV